MHCMVTYATVIISIHWTHLWKVKCIKTQSNFRCNTKSANIIMHFIMHFACKYLWRDIMHYNVHYQYLYFYVIEQIYMWRNGKVYRWEWGGWSHFEACSDIDHLTDAVHLFLQCLKRVKKSYNKCYSVCPIITAYFRMKQLRQLNQVTAIWKY